MHARTKCFEVLKQVELVVDSKDQGHGASQHGEDGEHALHGRGEHIAEEANSHHGTHEQKCPQTQREVDVHQAKRGIGFHVFCCAFWKGVGLGLGLDLVLGFVHTDTHKAKCKEGDVTWC